MELLDFASFFDRLRSDDLPETAQTAGGMNIRLVRVQPGSVGNWGSHPQTAETVIVWKGDFTVELRDRSLSLSAGQCCVVPMNAEHRGASKAGAEIILFQTEPVAGVKR